MASIGAQIEAGLKSSLRTWSLCGLTCAAWAEDFYAISSDGIFENIVEDMRIIKIGTPPMSMEELDNIPIGTIGPTQEGPKPGSQTRIAGDGQPRTASTPASTNPSRVKEIQDRIQEMMPFDAPTPTEAELEEALDDAASGDVLTDQGYNDAITNVLLRVLEQGYVNRVDKEEAMRLRQEMEDEENIAESEANAD